MGRQAYLAKIAFGRSAFEPTEEVTLSDKYLQLESSQAELPLEYHNFSGNNYIQLYDERGNPINPRSTEYGKKLRNAQNDVLAAVGAVERRQSPVAGLPGSYAARLEELEDEDTAGNALALVLAFAQQFSIWWVGTIRDRILTFQYDDILSFAQITTLEHAISGNSIFYTGAAARSISAICTQSIVYSAFVYRPIERVLLATYSSTKTRRLLRRSRGVLRFGLRLVVEALFYPLAYHANLQRLGLVPARPLLPTWRTFLPFSHESPLTPFSLYYSPTASTVDFLKATLTSPVVLWCAEQFCERWIYASISEAVEISITRPDNPDIVGSNTDNEHRTSTILGLRRESPRPIRGAVTWLLTAIGWAQPLAHEDADSQQADDVQSQTQHTEVLNVNESGTTIVDLTPLDIPVIQAQDQHAELIVDVNALQTSIDTATGLERPTTPPTPTAFEFQDGDDPRIRITSRDNIVEMEVRLPPRIISARTEVADTLDSSQDTGVVQTQHITSSSGERPYHRVSQLSIESSRMLGAMVKGQLVGLAVIPLKIIVLRLTASHYLAGDAGFTGSHMSISALSRPGDLTWNYLSTQMSRIALCSALQVAIDLGLWGFQYMTAVQIGQSFFGWGNVDRV